MVFLSNITYCKFSKQMFVIRSLDIYHSVNHEGHSNMRRGLESSQFGFEDDEMFLCLLLSACTPLLDFMLFLCLLLSAYTPA